MKKLALLCTSLFLLQNIYAQTDSLKFNTGDVLIGDIKEMSSGILKMETDYSDSDFTIEWDKVTEFYSNQIYTVALDDRSILTEASIKTTGVGMVDITSPDGNRSVPMIEIVYLRSLDSGFWSKMSANIDIGFSVTKANNLRQYNARAGLGYKTDKWILTGTYNQVQSSQDDAENTERTDASIGADYQLKNSFFIGASINFLSNTEQLLDLRTSGQVGLGYYIIRSGTMYWNGFIGTAFNNENYTPQFDPEMPNTPIDNDRQSMEGVVGMELNMFDTGDLNIVTNAYWYPSFTESGRNRVDYRFDIKYDLPLDFYIKAGLTYNWDSDPIEGASESDYVVQTGFGWEL